MRVYVCVRVCVCHVSVVQTSYGRWMDVVLKSIA